MPYRKLKPEALGHEKLEVEHIRRGCPGDVGSICFEGYWIIGGLSGKEERSQPAVV